MNTVIHRSDGGPSYAIPLALEQAAADKHSIVQLRKKAICDIAWHPTVCYHV